MNTKEEESDYGSEYGSEEDEDKPEYKSEPKECTSKEAAKYLVGKKNVAILTGSGVSLLSGVKTCIGKDGIPR